MKKCLYYETNTHFFIINCLWIEENTKLQTAKHMLVLATKKRIETLFTRYIMYLQHLEVYSFSSMLSS